MKGISILAYSVSELEQKIQDIESSFEATLGIVFSSIKHDFRALQKIFRDRDIDVIGASSSGEFIAGELAENSIVLLLLDIKRTHYHLYFAESNYDNSYEIGKNIAQCSKKHFNNAVFMTVFSLTVSGEKIIGGIHSELGEKVPIFGGMASDDFTMDSTTVFTTTQLSNEGICTLILDNDKIEVESLAISGWQPIGLINTITKAKANVIYEINGKPALDEYIKFCGDFQDGNAIDDIVSISSAQYPLQILRGGTAVLRALLYVDQEEKTIIMAGAVNEGDTFRFSIAPGFEILDETLDGFKKYRATFKNEIDIAIAFSCKARHMSLGPMIEDEIEGLYEIWDKKPMIGFFSYGEIGQDIAKKSHLYNETCALAIIREK
ncbi:MAG: FIST signal transduction protein [Chitinophagales bacterium]